MTRGPRDRVSRDHSACLAGRQSLLQGQILRLIVALRGVGVTWTYYPTSADFPTIFEARIAAPGGRANDESSSATETSRMLCALRHVAVLSRIRRIKL